MTDIGSPNCCCYNYHPWLVYEWDTDYTVGNSIGDSCSSTEDDPFPERLVRVPVVVVTDCHWKEPDDIEFCGVAKDSTALIHWAEIESEPVLTHIFSQGLRDPGVSYAWHIVCADENCNYALGGQKLILVDWSQVGEDGTEAAVIVNHDLDGNSDGITVHYDEQVLADAYIRWDPIGFKGLSKNWGWGYPQDGVTLHGVSMDSSEIYYCTLRQGQGLEAGCDISYWSRSGGTVSWEPWEVPNNGSSTTGKFVTLHGDIGRDLSEPVEWDLEYSLDNYVDSLYTCENNKLFGLRTFKSIPAPMAIAYRDPGRAIGVRVTQSGVVDTTAVDGVIHEAPQSCIWHWDEAGVDGREYEFTNRISLVSGSIALTAHPNPSVTDQVVTVKGVDGSGAATLPPNEIWFNEATYKSTAWDRPTTAGSHTLHQGVTPYMYDGHASGDCVAFTTIELLGDDVYINIDDSSLAGGVAKCGECDDEWDEMTPQEIIDSTDQPKMQYGSHSMPGVGAGDFITKWQLKNNLIVNGALTKTEHLWTVTEDSFAGAPQLTWADGPAIGKYTNRAGFEDSTSIQAPKTRPDSVTAQIDPKDYCPSIHCCTSGSVAVVWWDEWKLVQSYDASQDVNIETMRWKVEFSGGGSDSPVSQRQNIKANVFPNYGPQEWYSSLGGDGPSARIHWLSYRPRVQWSSDRWVYIYDFPLLTKLDEDGNQVEGEGYLGNRLSDEVLMDQIVYPGENDGNWKRGCFRNLPEYRRSAHKELEIYDADGGGYYYGARVWYPDADGAEYTCIYKTSMGGPGYAGREEFNASHWTAEVGDGWMWRDWMVSVEDDIWIPIGCRDEDNRPWATSVMYQDNSAGWRADALCQSKGANEVPLIPPRADHGNRRPEQPLP